MSDEEDLTPEDAELIAQAIAAARHLDVLVAAIVSGAEEVQFVKQAEFDIPTDYSSDDVRALIASMVTQGAFQVGTDAFGYSPQQRALLAATARVVGVLAKIMAVPHDDSERGLLAKAVKAVIDLSNIDAIAQYGDEAPENQ